MAGRSFANLDSRKVTWLIIAVALIAISITLRWPTLAITILHPSSSPILWYLIGVHTCICIWLAVTFQAKLIAEILCLMY